MGFVRTSIAGFVRTCIRPLGASLQFVRDDVPDLHEAGTGIEYWRDGLERRMPRWWEVKWRGRVLIRIRSHHNERAYWRSRRDLTDLIDEMTAAALLPPLQSSSHVLEPGCNVAQNLWELSRRWRCHVHGLDIDAPTDEPMDVLHVAPTILDALGVVAPPHHRASRLRTSAVMPA